MQHNLYSEKNICICKHTNTGTQNYKKYNNDQKTQHMGENIKMNEVWFPAKEK